MILALLGIVVGHRYWECRYVVGPAERDNKEGEFLAREILSALELNKSLEEALAQSGKQAVQKKCGAKDEYEWFAAHWWQVLITGCLAVVLGLVVWF